jgi:LysM repeat protein
VNVIQAQSANLLTNPGFESPFVTRSSGVLQQRVANGWNAWHEPAAEGSPAWQNTEPEYYEATDTDRIRSGSNAQRFESFFATHTGGVFQVINGIPAGSELTFSVYSYVWSSALDDEDVSEDDGDVFFQVGIDPTGGTNGTSDNIIWSVPTEQYDSYRQYSVSALASAGTVSVWVRSRVGFPVKASRIFVDDSTLTVKSGSGGNTNPTAQPATAQPTSVAGVPTSVVSTSVVVSSPTAVVSTPTLRPTTGTGGPGATVTPLPASVNHLIQRGDTLTNIAARYGSTVAAILQANGLTNSNLIFTGQTIIVPVASAPATATPRPNNAPTAIVVATTVPTATRTTVPPVATQIPSTYVIQPGDTLSNIARRFNTTVAAIAQLNGIVNSNSIISGQRINVPGTTPAPGTGGVIIVTPRPTVVVTSTPRPTVAPVGTVVPTSYVIQPGDTLYRLSLRFGVSITELIVANNITDPNRIFTGQRLVIP